MLETNTATKIDTAKQYLNNSNKLKPNVTTTTITEIIESITGNIEPLMGNIQPLMGNIESLTGNIEPITGNIEPLTGNIEPLTGMFCNQTLTKGSTNQN